MEINNTQNNYRVNLEAFEGPLDLLLYLIKKNDLDIYDIPIAFILEEYLRYLDTIKEMDIDLAGEFLLMSAELAYIKSKMLLPGETMDDAEAEEEIDPRADLVKRLLEYQRYKEASEDLLKRSMLGRDVFVSPKKIEQPEDDDKPLEANVYELISAFSQILQKMPKGKMHEVTVDRISVNARIFQIIEFIKKDVTISLEELLCESSSRYDVVVTFLAILEMARLKIIKVYQGGVQDTIRIRGSMEKVDDSEVMRLVQIEGIDEKENSSAENKDSNPEV